MQSVIEYVEANRARFLQTLLRHLEQPSITGIRASVEILSRLGRR